MRSTLGVETGPCLPNSQTASCRCSWRLLFDVIGAAQLGPLRLTLFEYAKLGDPSLLDVLAFSRMSGVGVEVLVDDKMSLAKKR